MKTLPATDVIIIGGGWSGLLIAKELGARTGLSIVVLERGTPARTAEYQRDMDELDYAVRLRMMQDASRETVTLRHTARDRALPLRQHGSFLPGSGVGGAGEHWNGVTPRGVPDSFQLLSKSVEKYGVKRLPEDHAIQDWGVTYDDLEPYYTRAELLMGISGKAGNIQGKLMPGGNIFEGWRSAEYPTPPTKIPYLSALFRDAAKSLGYHPYPIPAATASERYTNPDGMSRPACTYCGYCERFGCMIGAKAQPSNTLLPVIQKQKNVSIRTAASVRRITHDSVHGKDLARGVTYVDTATGEECFQPADLVFLTSWTLNNTRLLLLSRIGEPYDPSTAKGVVGRNLTHQVSFAAAQAFMAKPLNRFMGSGASGISLSDMDGDMLDRSKGQFLRGGIFLTLSSGDRPIANFGVVPDTVTTNWGSEWKKAAVSYYDRTGAVGFVGEHLAYKGNCMDLDPTYKDQFGDPLLRLTLDWRDNEHRMAEFAASKAVEIAKAMGATEINSFKGLGQYDARRYQSTHIQGGAVMGASPEHSVVNPYLQHWQVSNLFVVGGSSFPQNFSANPTLTILAQTYRTVDTVVERYLKNPGTLA
jgi:gluconate 2-dehydrogenase alpha chain